MQEKEDGGIEVALWGTRADPVGIGSLIAEVSAGRIAFKAAINNVVFTLITAGESDFKRALACVGGCRSVCCGIVLEKGCVEQKYK